jgi:hypothetical protein
MTLPLWTRSLVPADYGDGKEDYAGLPVVNERTDVSAAEWNALAQLAAAVARTLPAWRGLLYLSSTEAEQKVHWLAGANGYLLISEAGVAFDEIPGGGPTIEWIGGSNTQTKITFPTTMTSLDGQAEAYQIRCVAVYAGEGQSRVVQNAVDLPSNSTTIMLGEVESEEDAPGFVYFEAI